MALEEIDSSVLLLFGKKEGKKDRRAGCVLSAAVNSLP